ncbi:MAG: diguanylate cyclase [Clostridia bacterium]|nr:diguanylate cyclase [Clostridia bacterium]
MINTKSIVIIDDTEEVYNLATKLFEEESDYEFTLSSSKKESINKALEEIPNLIIINGDDLEKNVLKICEYIRKNPDNAITPMIVTSSSKEEDFREEVLKRVVEYYIPKPLHEIYFYYTIKNLSRLIDANRCISNLTGLPGNVQIEIELKRRVSGRKLYAVLYIDLDNFKAYNDKYGFMNGDEIIKFTANTMRDAIQKYGTKGDFLGHIGGDDFVAVVAYENARKIGKEIIKQFDANITDFYSEEDVKNGYVKIPNRKGKMEKYPLMTITVAMISNKIRKYDSVLELGEDGASVKKKAKTIEGSTFLENRRKNPSK